MFDNATCPEESSVLCLEGERRALVPISATRRLSLHFIAASRYVSQVARVREVSQSGIGLIFSNHIAPNTLLLIELRTEPGRFAHGVLARVVHAEPQAENGWLVGCAFIDGLSLNEMQALL